MKGIAFIIAIAIFAALIVYSSLSWGYVAEHYWNWFLLPVFPDLPKIGYWDCVGLMFVIGLFKHKSYTIYTDEFKEKYLKEEVSVFAAMISPWISLCVAWFIKSLFL